MLKRITITVELRVKSSFPSQVFANSNELHFRRNDALSRVVHLSHATTRLCAQRGTAQSGKVFEAAFIFVPCQIGGIKSQITIINGFRFATLILLHVVATHDPFTSQRGQAIPHIALKQRIAPWTTRIVTTHGGVLFEGAIEGPRLCLRDLAEGNAHAWLLSVNVDSF